MSALRLLVVHDNADREFDYIAGVEKVMSAAQEQDWSVISIKQDWRVVFPANKGI